MFFVLYIDGLLAVIMWKVNVCNSKNRRVLKVLFSSYFVMG